MIEVAGIPVVELMDSQSPCLDIAVGFDNFEAARQMTTAILLRRVLKMIAGIPVVELMDMLAHYGYKPEMEQERLESMLSWNIDGLILTERTHTPRTLKMIEVAGIPVVELMDSKSPCLDIAVGFDNFEAARQMTTAIIARGHRHIAYLGARLDERTIIKQKGYEQAMLDAGLVPYSVMVEQSSSYSSGIELIRQAC